MSIPVLALLGRPNVGKSTLFNTLSKSRSSLVSNMPGLTRDRNYASAKIGNHNCRLIDTGGLLREEEELIDFRVDEQARIAITEADVLLFLVDGEQGLNAVDEQIAAELRRSKKPVILVVNKIDRGDAQLLMSEFYSLGFKNTIAISAEHKRGLKQLEDLIIRALEEYPDDYFYEENPPEEGIILAVLGRPNAGKSTLLNRLLGENRLVASAQAGTTRDSIYIPYQAEDGSAFTFIDTAGIRRKARVNDKIEKFSIVKALQAIETANVVLLVLDAHEGISDQDAHLLGEINRRGRALVIAINKWDNLKQDERDLVKKQLELKLNFVDFAEIFYISAIRGSNVHNLLPAVKRAYESAMVELSTNKLTEALEIAYHKHQPPLVNGYNIKMQYAHQGGKNPPHIIIHGSRTTNVPQSYQQYLSKFFRKHFNLQGTPIRISFRDKNNPYV